MCVLGLFFLSLFFSGCETENISGGSSEHENVVQVKNIPVQVVDENGRFLKYVQLNFIEWSHWASFLEEGKSILIDTVAIADKRGRLSIESGFCSHAALDVKFGVLDKFWGNVSCSEAEPFVKLSVGNPEVQCGKTLPNLPVAVYGTDVISQSDGYGAWKLNIPPNLSRRDVVVKYEGFWRPLGEKSASLAC